MKRRERHELRQAMIDACRLLGYTIELHKPWQERYNSVASDYKRIRYVVRDPDGTLLSHFTAPNTMLYGVRTFEHMWQAALAVLNKHGVDVHALVPPRTIRTAERHKRKIQRETARQTRGKARATKAWLKRIGAE